MARPRKQATQETESESLESFGAFEAGTESPEIQTPPAAEASQPRVYRGTQDVDHDLFKLKVAKMRKNTAWDGSENWVSVEHCHIFHTVDSSGRAQTTCSPVGGHFHEITVSQSPGNAPTLLVSQAKQYAKKKLPNGRMVKVAVDMPDDSHSHDAEYLGSQKIRLRQPNVEAAKVESVMRAKFDQPAIGGIVER
jgi:hypothetical protein